MLLSYILHELWLCHVTVCYLEQDILVHIQFVKGLSFCVHPSIGKVVMVLPKCNTFYHLISNSLNEQIAFSHIIALCEKYVNYWLYGLTWNF